MAAAEMVCGADCWGLVDCIGPKCPDYGTDRSNPQADTSCVGGNCSSFLAGAPGATMVGRCARTCAAQCRPN
jgi:hypothetical protein